MDQDSVVTLPRRSALAAIAAVVLLGACGSATKQAPKPKPERMTERNRWIPVRLVGAPKDIGFQHGSMLTPEIEDAKKAVELLVTHDTEKPWTWYRDAAKNVLWPKVEPEYQQELQGIADGLKSKGSSLDVWDVTALNGWMELAWYYAPSVDPKPAPEKKAVKSKKGKKAKAKKARARRRSTPEHCSAFVATGSYTKDGQVVMAHNAWVDYLVGTRWRVVFDIIPDKGHRIMMDGFPGLIHSADDFAINSAGMMITETTISQFNGFDTNGVPEFVRARKAAQYASTIDDFAKIMKEGNNGGYANNWLAADRKTGEIASLELGLKNVAFNRKKDGYFAGSNFPTDPKITKEETSFNPKNKSTSACARQTRWEQLLEQNKGKIDVALAREFLADDFDAFAKKRGPNERTICGRIDLSPRGSAPWQKPYGPAGAVQNKATDTKLAQRMAFWGAYGALAGPKFDAKAFVKKHPRYAWQAPLLQDMAAGEWTLFEAAR